MGRVYIWYPTVTENTKSKNNNNNKSLINVDQKDVFSKCGSSPQKRNM